MKIIDLDALGIDPNDSWAEVELYRWQYGVLPPNDETCKELDVPTGLRGMATAIEKGNMSNFPSPMNVISVLRYAAKLLEAKSNSETEA